jgi:hypothetical protein
VKYEAKAVNYKPWRIKREQWRQVVGWEGIYEVSSLGRVRNVMARTRTFVGRLLKPNVNRKGYLTVRLMRLDRDVTRLVHSLVADAFVGRKPKGLQVNHKDTNKANNDYRNLEYKTCAENIEHAVKHGLRAPKHGTLNGCAKVVEKDIEDIRKRYAGGETQREIGEDYGMTQANVSEIVRRRTWRHVP